MFKAKIFTAALLAVVLGWFLLLAPIPPALAQQQPPTADDQLLMQQLKGPVAGRVSIPDTKSGLLIQPEGRDWRAFREGPVKIWGIAVILGMVVVLAVFFAIRGRIRIEGGSSSRRILRFNGLERFTHWMTAVSFVILGLSGLNLVFGRSLLLPLVGPETFATLAHYGKVAHNYLSFPFVLGLILMAVLWLRDNIFTADDVTWLKHGGGLMAKGGGPHLPAGKFNGGQKIIFWAVILGGAALAVTGYMLMFPFAVADMPGMQAAQVVHALLALLLIAVIIAHIYIGSLGMEGAFEAMGSGEVDLNWAKTHHPQWVEQTGQGKAVGHD